MRASGAPSQMARIPTAEHLFQSELQRKVKKRSLIAGGLAFDIHRCLKDDPLQTYEFSLQFKYKGEVKTTMEIAGTGADSDAEAG